MNQNRYDRYRGEKKSWIWLSLIGGLFGAHILGARTIEMLLGLGALLWMIIYAVVATILDNQLQREERWDELQAAQAKARYLEARLEEERQKQEVVATLLEAERQKQKYASGSTGIKNQEKQNADTGG